MYERFGKDFRFRGWIRSAETMTEPFSFSDFDGDFLMTPGVSLDDLVVMQATGARDVMGKEIWEGDILYSESPTMRLPRRWKVIWHGSHFWIDDRRKYPLSYIHQLRARVVGNIYAHPHLLRQTDRIGQS